MDEWLENLKRGDQVLLGDYLSQVQRVTPTMVILTKGSRFSRRTGRSCGSDSYGPVLTEPTSTELARIRHKGLSRTLANADWRALPLELLEEVQRLISNKNTGDGDDE